MQKYKRQAVLPARKEIAVLAAIIDPSPAALPRDVVVLLRQARRHCDRIIRTLKEDEYYCVAMQTEDFEHAIDEILQKYAYSRPECGLDYWDWNESSRD